MTKLQKLLAALCSLICLVACALTLAFYFGFKPSNKSNGNQIQIQNVVVFEGKSATINYELADKNSSVNFSVSDESIAKVINNREITGLKVGQTFLSAKVKNKNQEFSALALIKVIAKESDDNTDNDDTNSDDNNNEDKKDEYQELQYQILITPTKECIYQNSSLYVKKNSVFQIQVFEDETLSKTLDFNVYCSAGLTIYRELNLYYLTALSDGEIIVAIPDLNKSVSFDVYLYD